MYVLCVFYYTYIICCNKMYSCILKIFNKVQKEKKILVGVTLIYYYGGCSNVFQSSMQRLFVAVTIFYYLLIDLLAKSLTTCFGQQECTMCQDRCALVCIIWGIEHMQCQWSCRQERRQRMMAFPSRLSCNIFASISPSNHDILHFKYCYFESHF